MKNIKILAYTLIPLALVAYIIKLTIFDKSINMFETGIILLIVMWVVYFLVNRLMSREIRLKAKSAPGFQIVHKDRKQPSEEQTTHAPKFFHTGNFQIIHKGRPLGANTAGQDDKMFKMPVYRTREQRPPANAENPANQKVHFGTAGIRGLTNIEITPQLVLKMSEIYGAYISPPPVVKKMKVAVGCDTRFGSEMLRQIAIAGLNSAGVNTIDCGLITTGGLASYIVSKQLDGGVLITGSHTPYDMTGYIIFKSDGSYLDNEMARELEKRYQCYEKFRSQVKPENIGGNQPAPDAPETYKSFLLGKIDQALIKSNSFSILVDPANGPASLILPAMLKELGCRVTIANGELAPIPNRPSEPRATNLGETAAKVKESKSDIGIATDVDADRVLFIDANGKVLSEDTIGAIFARANISAGRTCVTPINSSGLIEDVVAECSGKLEYCRIGQPETIKSIKEHNADFSYEESGKYYFCKQALWPDALLSSLKLLEILAKKNTTLEKLASEFPPFFQVKHKITLKELGLDRQFGFSRILPPIDGSIPLKRDGQSICTGSAPDIASNLNKVYQKIQELWAGEITENSKSDITIDGLKRTYNDKSWLLIRKSGTEPLIRVYADAPTPERAQELVEKGERLVRKACQSFKPN